MRFQGCLDEPEGCGRAGHTENTFLTSPLAPRGYIHPRGELCPLGVRYTPSFTPRGEHSLLFRRMEGRKENLTPVDNFTPRGQKFTPGGQLRPWGSKFAPRGEVKNGPLFTCMNNDFCVALCRAT
jgi:hypothetical protein